MPVLQDKQFWSVPAEQDLHLLLHFKHLRSSPTTDLYSSLRQVVKQLFCPVYKKSGDLHVIQSFVVPAVHFLHLTLHFVHTGLLASAVFLNSS